MLACVLLSLCVDKCFSLVLVSLSLFTSHNINYLYLKTEYIVLIAITVINRFKSAATYDISYLHLNHWFVCVLASAGDLHFEDLLRWIVVLCSNLT